jgi:serine/threonine-protein kinase
MGTVYRALDPTIGRTVAIKAIRLTDFVDPAERERVRDRLLQEARSAGLLSHPNIITIYDVLEDEGSAFIVMEYVDGPSLGDMLRAGQLPELRQLLRYFGQIADGLDHAHRKGVIHRDIKSANILISSEHDHAGLAKISDFGISKFISQDTTHSGTMVGTPNYMAPEQIQGLALDGRSDQFSFAVIVYEMLTGTKPFRAESLATLFYQVCRQEPAPPHDLNPSLTPQVDEVLARALAKDPDGRFASCTDFISSLAAALNGLGDWDPDAVTAHETIGMANAAAAAAGADLPTVTLSAQAPRRYHEPGEAESAPVIIPDRSPEPELLPLPRRARFERGDEEEYEGSTDGSWRNRALLIVPALAIVGVLLFFSTRSSHREPSPSASVGNPPSNTQSAEKNGDATGTGSGEPKQGETKGKGTAREHTPASGPQNIPLPTSSPVDVLISTQPAGARVIIDNHSERACQAPCITVLPPGRHTLTAELKGFDTARRIFTVPDEKQLTIALSQSMGVLLVTTEPSGSTVMVDGKQYGQTPLTLRLPIGSHQLAIVNGAGRHEENVVIENDQFTTRSFRWQ